jgi:hypothetical protein
MVTSTTKTTVRSEATVPNASEANRKDDASKSREDRPPDTASAGEFCPETKICLVESLFHLRLRPIPAI